MGGRGKSQMIRSKRELRQITDLGVYAVSFAGCLLGTFQKHFTGVH